MLRYGVPFFFVLVFIFDSSLRFHLPEISGRSQAISLRLSVDRIILFLSWRPIIDSGAVALLLINIFITAVFVCLSNTGFSCTIIHHETASAPATCANTNLSRAPSTTR